MNGFRKCVIFIQFYSAIKKNETLSFACKLIELENIILSEISCGGFPGEQPHWSSRERVKAIVSCPG
jgi:hypothetical protein